MNGAALGPCPHCGEAHSEEMLVCPTRKEQLPLAGRLLASKFRFENLLGEGGMGWVWKAENVLVKKAVAIKLMRPEFASNPAILARFRNEATAAGQIGSPHICDILDFGQSDLGPFIVMEMMKGRSLGELIEKSGRVDPGLAVIIVRQALEGLGAAHRAGIIHRDLKPDNIFLSEPAPGRLLVKLMDFGISKFSQDSYAGKTGVGVLMGTPEYMSPEQSQGAAGVDERTDIWAMGLILYKSITGIDAFGGPTIAATLVNVATREPPPLDSIVPVPPELSAVIARCIAKEPSHRFASADELSHALAPFEGLAGMMPPQPQPTHAPSGPLPTGAGAHASMAPMGAGTHAPMASMASMAPMAPMGAGTHAPSGPGTHGGLAPGPKVSGPATHAATLPPPNPGFVSEAAAVGDAPRGATWSAELGSARSRAGDDDWSLGSTAAEIADERRRPEPRPSSKAPIYLVLLLVLGGLGAGAYFAFFAPPSASDTPENPQIGPADAGETKSADASVTAAVAATATTADASATTTGSATADAATAATSTAAAATSTAAATSAAAEPEPEPEPEPPKPPTKTKVTKKKLKDVVTGGSLVTPDKAPSPMSRSEAKRHCQDLDHGGSADWELASLAEATKFKGNRGISMTLYWTTDLVDRSTGKAFNTRDGSVKEMSINDKARPLCVTAK